MRYVPFVSNTEHSVPVNLPSNNTNKLSDGIIITSTFGGLKVSIICVVIVI